jgi:hypothetical protein
MTAATKTGARAKPSPKAKARATTPSKAAKAPAKASKTKAPPKPTGRPSLYTPEVAERICAGLAQGTPLTVICAEPGMPADRTVREWAEKDEELSAAIARARELGFDKLALEALAIADETHRDTIHTDNGERPNAEWIARSKLRIETRLKLLAKWDPKRYGEKTTTEVTGDGGGPVQHSLAVRFVTAEGGSQ